MCDEAKPCEGLERIPAFGAQAFPTPKAYDLMEKNVIFEVLMLRCVACITELNI
jgi:hypothetical protein